MSYCVNIKTDKRPQPKEVFQKFIERGESIIITSNNYPCLRFGTLNKALRGIEVNEEEYQHGLLLTKPLHHSQKETLPFGEHDCQWYGEVTLTIEPNRELRGKILLYGENLEVMQPQPLREQIKEILAKQLENYSNIKE